MAKQKLHCYVDESGQDPKSRIFVVVTVVSDKEQNELRKQLLEVENLAKTGNRKWHKTRTKRRLKYLQLVLEKGIAKGDVYFGCYEKPLPYFLPLLETIRKSIIAKAKSNYQATIYIDGIDKKKSIEFTNALRFEKIKTGLVKSRRDESEPLIRLADMWAGCIRKAHLGGENEKKLLNKAKKHHYLNDVQKQKPL